MVFNKNRKWVFFISAFFFLSSLLFTFSISDRGNFTQYFIPYTIAFSFYLFICFKHKEQSKNIFILTILVWIAAIIFPPYLSNDYYRFLWDGELCWNGINPYDFTPKELIIKESISDNLFLQDLYKGMSDLTKSHYSCYPPLNQFYFILSTAFTDSIFWNVILLKIFILLTEITGLFYLLKLLKLLKIDLAKAYLLFLNPLFILEGIANVHFEGVMISFLIIAFHFLFSSKIVLSGSFFAFAIQIKLIPLMLLPFLWRFLGWRKSITLYSIIGFLLILFSLLLLNSSNIPHFIKSILLYFGQFEFNSSILFILLHIDPLSIQWYKLNFYAPFLSKISLMAIILLAFLKKDASTLKFFSKMSVAFFIYLLLNSTVHPWYILPLLFLCLFTNYIFALVWSFLVIFSYSFYGNDDIAQTNWTIYLEYFIVLLLFIYEMIKGGLLNNSSLRIIKAE